MASRGGHLVISYNGEIYNYRELRLELETRGHGFRSESDTEVLLAALEEWGLEALPRLNGMFAFVLYDRRKRRLLLARDRYGIKPLYYTVIGHDLAVRLGDQGIPRPSRLSDARWIPTG